MEQLAHAVTVPLGSTIGDVVDAVVHSEALQGHPAPEEFVIAGNLCTNAFRHVCIDRLHIDINQDETIIFFECSDGLGTILGGEKVACLLRNMRAAAELASELHFAVNRQALVRKQIIEADEQFQRMLHDVDANAENLDDGLKMWKTHRRHLCRRINRLVDILKPLLEDC
jgi:hypothetical protein